MAGRSRSSFNKRLKERSRQEKAREKAEKKVQKKLGKEEGGPGPRVRGRCTGVRSGGEA